MSEEPSSTQKNPFSNLTRRGFLTVCGLFAALPWPPLGKEQPRPGILVNDVQTGLNPTYVARIWPVRKADDVVEALTLARDRGWQVSIAGARHAAGGQEFGGDTLLLDTRDWGEIIDFDEDAGTIDVSGGTEWPQLMAYYLAAEKGKARQWGIAQKQGGLDHLTLGGTISANAHGHTLTLPPIVHDVESFELIDAASERRLCSREVNPELFRLAIGGYGLFGVISRVRLRLIPRCKLRRNVRWARIEELVERIEERTKQGSLYGDFQYSIDSASDDFMVRGLLTTHDLADASSTPDEMPREASSQQLEQMLYLAHVDKEKAFRLYAEDSLASSGEFVWSDTHQYSPYPRGYHRRIDRRLPGSSGGSDPLWEVYVPRPLLTDYFLKARKELLERKANLIYGTVRFVKRDMETFLPWATEDYACVIFTVHTERTPEDLMRTEEMFRALLSMALESHGSYYLTYNRWATRVQVETAYPQFAEYLRLKRKYDPGEMFQSDWYRHYREMFSGA